MKPIQIKFKKELLIPELKPYMVNIEGESYIRHFLCWSTNPVDPTKKTEGNSMVNMMYKSKKEFYVEEMTNKDYEGVLILLDKHTQMGWFIKNYKKIHKDVGDERYYQMLSEVLVHVDFHDEYRKHYSKLLSQGKDTLYMMSKKERKQFDKLPQKLKIFRGTSSNNKITKSNLKKLFGNSWSLDKEISIWFSLKHSPKFRGSKYIVLLTYELDKREVVSYFTEREEKEIFLDYTKIDLNRISFEYIPKDYKMKTSFNKLQKF